MVARPQDGGDFPLAEANGSRVLGIVEQVCLKTFCFQRFHLANCAWQQSNRAIQER